MSYRLSKIYTRTGDDGSTQVEPKNRIPKNHPRIEALGTLDELNCAIGVLLSCENIPTSIRDGLTQVQQDLFNLGGELCPPHHQVIHAEKIIALEKWLDEWNVTLTPLTEFILPQGGKATTHCHMARAIARRAERYLVTLHQVEPIGNQEILKYVNRLSDVLFVIARVLGKNEEEVLWNQM